MTNAIQQTKADVADTLAACEEQGGTKAALTMARMIVKFGNVTDDARAHAEEYLACAS